MKFWPSAGESRPFKQGAGNCGGAEYHLVRTVLVDDGGQRLGARFLDGRRPSGVGHDVVPADQAPLRLLQYVTAKTHR